MEIEPDSGIPFLDVLVFREKTTQAAEVYRKPIHRGT
jgi:hypothetical protein